MNLSRGRLTWVAVAGLVVLAILLAVRGRRPEVRYATASADRGDVRETIGATGTLQAVVTVQVGSQVSGIIEELKADFNSVVKAGQVIARLDPSTFAARTAQAQANLAAARANTERARATVEDAKQKYDRARELAAQSLLPASDLETARTTYEGALAAVKASEAAVMQAAAALKQAQVDLRHTIIEAPIDGVVIARNVDVGQTVAASLQAPVLFVIANDLARMQVNASIDEADVGRLKTGQDATFRVDAYPDRTFRGRVEQVRLQPTTTQNVVTYSAIVNVDNPELLLKPGMTASVSIIVERREGVVRVPAAALRFRPPVADGASAARVEREGRPSGATGGAGGGGGTGPGGARGGDRARPPSAERGRPATVYTLGPKGPEPMKISVGASDGQFVEVKEGLAEGTRVIIGVEGEAGAATRPGQTGGASNPFNPQMQRRQR
jgi:HlyD family secretion protein